jgi:hypothetical protein
VFSVPGRTVVQKFGGLFPGMVLEAREYTVTVEAKLAHKKCAVLDDAAIWHR